MGKTDKSLRVHHTHQRHAAKFKNVDLLLIALRHHVILV